MKAPFAAPAMRRSAEVHTLMDLQFSLSVPHSRSNPFASSSAMGGVKTLRLRVIWLRMTFIWKLFSATSSSHTVHRVWIVLLPVVVTSRTSSGNPYSGWICRGGITSSPPRSMVGRTKKRFCLENCAGNVCVNE